MCAPIQRSIDKVINLYTVLEPSKSVIFVEGRQDFQFYSSSVEELGKKLTFVQINTVNFAELENSFPSHLERNNNRDKILFLIEEIHKKNPNSNVYGIIDRDILAYTRELNTLDANILLTDFGCLESYYLCDQNISKLNKKYCELITLETVNKICIAAAQATLIIIFEKKNYLQIPKVKSDDCHKPTILDFDFSKYIDKILINFKKNKIIDINNSKTELLNIKKSLSSTNPKEYLNGHYFMNFLLLYLKSEDKKRFQHTTVEQLEDIFRLSVETSFVSSYSLFQKLLVI